MNNNISLILEKKQCCGCGACINACKTKALKYSHDRYGFIIPKLNNEKCIQCGKCLIVCAAEHQDGNESLEAYAAMAKNIEDRWRASSGGIFGVISKKFIENNGIVVGAKMDNDFTVHHEIAKDEDSLKSILRSKYIQSDMRYIYDEIMELLKNGKIVLFSGTPCQVSAVKNYIPMKYRENLFLIDVVCHGVPSQTFFNSYISHLETKKGEIESYQFRAKRQVNNGMNCFFSYKVKGKDTVIRNWPEDTFNYLYMKSYIYRDSCYSCLYSNTKRCSDITLCDYWGWNNYQRGFEMGSTVSGVLINTDKGRQLLDEIKDLLIIEEAGLENIRKHNGCLVRPSEYSDKREQVFEAWETKGFAYIDEYYQKHNKKMIFKSKIMRLLPVNFMNTLVKIRLKF